MRKAPLIVTLLSLLCSAQAQSDWSGVWRIQRQIEGQVESIYNLFIRMEGEEIRPVIYQNTARPMTLQKIEFRAQDEYLEVQASSSAKQPLPIHFKFSRQGDRISGEWTFSHMQMGIAVTGSLVGFRTFSDADWDPWFEVENLRYNRFIDLGKMLATEAPLSKFSDFVGFWDSQIERNFYFLLQAWVYGQGTDPIDHKQGVLRRLFGRLQEEAVREQLQVQAGIAERVVRTAKILRGNDDLRFFLISFPGVASGYEEFLWSRVPTAEDEADCACKLDLRERFILLDPLRFSSARKTGPVLLEKEALTRSLWTPPFPPLAIQVYRKALALLLALEAQGAEWNLSEQTEAAARLEYGELLLQRHPINEAFESELATSLSHILGLRLLRQLRKDRTLLDLLKLSPQQIMASWQAFFSESS